MKNTEDGGTARFHMVVKVILFISHIFSGCITARFHMVVKEGLKVFEKNESCSSAHFHMGVKSI